MTSLTNLELSPFLSALRCFVLLCQHHGIEVVPERFLGAKEDNILGSLLLLMREVGMKSKLLKDRKWEDLFALGTAYPVMAEQKSGHWMIIANIAPTPDGAGSVAIMDPRSEQTGLVLMTQQQFEELWNGSILLGKREYDMRDGSEKFGLGWFMPEIKKESKLFRDIIVVSTVVNLLSFVTPISFQIMLDSVVPHQSYQTLYTLTAILILTTIFSGLFGYLQEMLLLFATNRIDSNLIKRSFEHMLSLPMPFFESMPTGVLIRHMQQTEGIRNFLTGSLFHTLLDGFAMPLLLFVLIMYSGVLTFVVVMFAAVMAAIIGIMIPAFRKHIEMLYNAEASRQADLIESIQGMRAIKSMALEPLRNESWSRKVANAIAYRTTVGHFGAIAVTTITGLQALMALTVLSLGILQVFSGNLSMGSLIAFKMLSGRVTGPLVKIVSLINEYQQTLLAIRKLGEVMNCTPERDPNQRGIRPPITGKLEFNHVTFRYDKTVTPALNKVTFKVEQGQMIGIVGRSGSGKTTVTRLIQSIHAAQEGLILLDGNDIRHYELPHLRRNVGVVLQENLLFRGTIRDNIAAAKPDASMEEVIEAAQLAGAEEFIDRLPHKYETDVEEGATNFSGGQKQRIAIARVLILKPNLLILDEATSALDPDSEAIIRKSLVKISKERTMLIVSHRLSSLVSTDAIMVLEKGEIIDFAPHLVLLERCEIYRHLWEQQNDYMEENTHTPQLETKSVTIGKEPTVS